jgi:hypothetical protein
MVAATSAPPDSWERVAMTLRAYPTAQAEEQIQLADNMVAGLTVTPGSGRIGP